MCNEPGIPIVSKWKLAGENSPEKANAALLDGIVTPSTHGK